MRSSFEKTPTCAAAGATTSSAARTAILETIVRFTWLLLLESDGRLYNVECKAPNGRGLLVLPTCILHLTSCTSPSPFCPHPVSLSPCHPFSPSAPLPIVRPLRVPLVGGRKKVLLRV